MRKSVLLILICCMEYCSTLIYAKVGFFLKNSHYHSLVCKDFISAFTISRIVTKILFNTLALVCLCNYLAYHIIQLNSIIQENLKKSSSIQYCSEYITFLSELDIITTNLIFSLNFLVHSILITFHNKQMSLHSNPRKWTNRFVEECAALYPATTRYSLKHRYPSSQTSESMSHLRHSRSSQMYNSFSSSFRKYDGSEVTKATQEMEKSLSRLSCVKCRHAEQCTTGLKKKGKENWKQAEKEQKQVVANVQTMPVQPIINTIHTVQTIFVPAPPPVVYQKAQVVYSRPVQTIWAQKNLIQLQRPVSAPKLSINYFSPPTYLVRNQPTFVPYELSVYR